MRETSRSDGSIAKVFFPSEAKPGQFGSSAFVRVSSLVQLIAAIASLVAIGVSCVAYLKTDRLEKLLEGADTLRPLITLTSPVEGSSIDKSIASIAGQITCRSANKPKAMDMNRVLARRKLDLVALVRPLSKANLWWAQTSLAIQPTGTFQGSVNLGEDDGLSNGLSFEIVIVMVPKGTIAQGDTFADLPVNASVSKIVTVKRVE